MRQTRLGRSDIVTAAAPLGAMYLGTKQDRTTSFRLLDHYVALGGNFIDTANIYAFWLGDPWKGGESETLLGEWMKERGNRQSLTIATKMGIAYQDVPTSLATSLIIAECEKSLKRLGTDVIDLYFAHRDDLAVPQDEVLQAFAKLIEQGKVRILGASNFSCARLASAHEISRRDGLPRYEVLQQRFSYLPVRRGGNTGPQTVLTPDMQTYCATSNVSVMAYSVTLGGAYDRYPTQPMPDEYRNRPNGERLAALRRVADQLGATPGQVVLAWTWAQPGLMPLVAGSTTAQLDQNIAAMDLPLTAEHLALLDNAAE